MVSASDCPGSGPSIRPPVAYPALPAIDGLFSDAASRLAGTTGALLGWRPEEFWKATPAEVGAVLLALVGEEQGPASTVDLARLMEMFPDG